MIWYISNREKGIIAHVVCFQVKINFVIIVIHFSKMNKNFYFLICPINILTEFKLYRKRSIVLIAAFPYGVI